MNRILYVLMCAILLAGCSKDDESISMVKGGTLQVCPNKTVNEMVKSFMGNPSWESGTGTNNEIFVNISGDITYSNKPVKGVLQFLVDKKNRSFQYNAFEINGVPQDNLTASGLLETMCGNISAAQPNESKQAEEHEERRAESDTKSRSSEPAICNYLRNTFANAPAITKETQLRKAGCTL